MNTCLVYPEKREIDKDTHSILTADIKKILPKSHYEQKYDISLILPMYNVAPYLRMCLDSVFNQIGINIQVIIVNDGSTDNSLNIAMDYLVSRNLNNAIIINQKNKGLSDSRNFGVAFAVSEYIAYIDTDDFVAPNAYATLYNFAVKNNLDMVLFRALIFNSFNLKFSEFYDSDLWEVILGGKSAFITDSHKNPELLVLQPSTCTKLIRKSYLLNNKLFFPSGLMFEDLPIHVKGILNTQRIGLLGSKFYMYRSNRPGKITDQRNERRFDILKIFDQTLEVSSTKNISSKQVVYILFALVRITYWCGAETNLNDRKLFFSRLAIKFSSIPNEWINSFKHEFRYNRREIAILIALRKNNINYLFKHSVGIRQILKTAFFFLQEQSYKTFFSALVIFLKNMVITPQNKNIIN
jgi:glycosyltransferase involved in cell wall biosynthesis